MTSLSANRDAYDDWFDAVAHAGEDAILFGDRWRPLCEDVLRRFDSVTALGALSVTRMGKQLDVHTIYLAKGFKPDGLGSGLNCTNR